VGINQIHLTLTRDGRLAEDVAAAQLALGDRDVPLKQYGEGHYAAQTDAISHRGRWRALIAVTGKDERHYAHSIPFTVNP
jgi:hypothetical protein